jgi:hypothetical protein
LIVKKNLRLLAATLLLAAFGYWAAAGANRGWTKNSVPKRTLDEVTGIEGVTYEKKFVPGVDFLGAAAGVAGVVALASLFFRNKNAGTTSQTEIQDPHT